MPMAPLCALPPPPPNEPEVASEPAAGPSEGDWWSQAAGPGATPGLPAPPTDPDTEQVGEPAGLSSEPPPVEPGLWWQGEMDEGDRPEP
jgi:hypothetical protein